MWRIFLVISVFLSGCNSVQIADKVEVTETTFSSGQALGEHYQSTPIRTQIFLKGLQTEDFKIDLGPEIITDIVSKPAIGSLVGVSPFFKISYPYPPSDFRLYLEGGAGPTYLSVGTVQQGSPGFNFIDQIGGGLEYNLTKDLGLVVKYRFAHISDARLRAGPNSGIESHAGLFSLRIGF